MPDPDPEQYRTSANLARRADIHVAYGRTRWFDWLADRMAPPAGSDVLDVGCGPGWFWRNVAGRMPGGLRLTLLDQSPGMVDEALAALDGQSPYASVKGVTASADDLPVADGEFDAVLMMHMLYHVEDPAAAIREAARALRPGGYVAITTNMPANLAELTAFTAKIHGTPPEDPAALLFSLDDAERALVADFANVRRSDLTEDYVCDDAEIVLAFLRSMPPANRATAAEAAALDIAVREALAAGDGVIRARKHTGLVVGEKPLARSNPLR